MISRILVGLLAGTIGGFLGWLLQENLINYNAHVVPGVLPGQGAINTGLTIGEARILALCVGGCIGLFLGAVDGIVEGSRRKLIRGIAIGVVAGFFLGYIGLFMGQWIFQRLGGTSEGVPNPGIFSFGQQVIARAFGWALMGLGLGAGSAISPGRPSASGKGRWAGFSAGSWAVSFSICWRWALRRCKKPLAPGASTIAADLAAWSGLRPSAGSPACSSASSRS